MIAYLDHQLLIEVSNSITLNHHFNARIGFSTFSESVSTFQSSPISGVKLCVVRFSIVSSQSTSINHEKVISPFANKGPHYGHTNESNAQPNQKSNCYIPCKNT